MRQRLIVSAPGKFDEICGQAIPLLEQVMLLAMLPVSAKSDPCASSCSGGSVVCLVPCMRCDVRGAEVQVGRTVWECVACCQ